MPSLSMLVKTEEASGPLSGYKPAMRVGLYKHRKASVQLYKNPAKTQRYCDVYTNRHWLGCHISDAPALCDWALPPGCLMTYGGKHA